MNKSTSPKTLILVFLIPLTLLVLGGIGLVLKLAKDGSADSGFTMQVSFSLLGVLGAAVALSFIAHLGFPLGRRIIMAVGLVTALYLTQFILGSLTQPILPMIGTPPRMNFQIRAVVMYVEAMAVAWGLALVYFGLKAGYAGGADDPSEEPAAR